eukprot:3788855-Pleurochrysis_carterae.AAC.5
MAKNQTPSKFAPKPNRPAPKAAEEQRKVSVNSANTITKDFLLLSQPVIHQGVLIASASSGRRLYVHHLSEIPLSEVFLTRTGNHVQRVDKATVKLAGSISIRVTQIPQSSVPSVALTAQIPTSVFSGPISGRDHKVLQLLQRGAVATCNGVSLVTFGPEHSVLHRILPARTTRWHAARAPNGMPITEGRPSLCCISGKDANTSGDFATACACFEAAYALSVRAGMLVSAANMRLKLSQPQTAAAMYRRATPICLATSSQQAHLLFATTPDPRREAAGRCWHATPCCVHHELHGCGHIFPHICVEAGL